MTAVFFLAHPNMPRLLKNIVVLLLIVGFFAESALIVHAQTSGDTTLDPVFGTALGNAASNVTSSVGCAAGGGGILGSIGGLLGNAASSIGGTAASSIGSALGLGGGVSSALGGLAGGGEVPVRDRSVISNTQSIARSQSTLVNKECVLDGIARGLQQVILRQVTTSIIRWANSGFQGNPSFITDINGFLRGVADQAFGEFLADNGLAGLCTAFRTPVLYGVRLYFQEPFQRRAACTLSDITSSASSFFNGGWYGGVRTKVISVDRFIEGDWSSGGWGTWYGMVTQDQNNPYGAFLLSVDEGQKRMNAATYAAERKASYGSGFLSFEDCKTVQGINGPQKQCQIVTPGSIIRDQVNSAIGTDLRVLENADEINELISAVASGLVLNILGGQRGLLGIGDSRTGTNTSYLDVYSGTSNSILSGTAQEDALAMVSRSLQDEYALQNTITGTLSYISQARLQVEAVAACYNTKISSGTLSSQNLALAQTNILAASSTINTLIVPREEILKPIVSSTASNIKALTDIETALAFAQTDGERAVAATAYQNLLLQNKIHTGADLADAVSFRQTIINEMNDIMNNAAAKQNECANFPPPETTIL